MSRNEHDRTEWHHGTFSAALVALSEAVDSYSNGDDIETVVRSLWERATILDNPPSVAAFSMASVFKKAREASFPLDSFIAALSALGFTADAVILGMATIRPVSDVARSGSGISRSSGSEQWPLVDETPNDNADWVRAGANNAFWTVQCADPGLTGRTIKKVVVNWEGTNVATSSANKLLIRDVNFSANYASTGSIAVGATTFSEEWLTRPWDSAAWTPADVAALVIGVRAAASGTHNCFTGSVWAVVHYY